MFLFSYLNVLNNQKRIGIFRSLGYRRSDIVTMFFIENGLTLILSASMGGIVSLLALSQINQTIFSDTIFSDLMLFSYEFDSILISFGVIVLLMISASVFSFVKMLRFSPVNIL